jgi:hypothetical protein
MEAKYYALVAKQKAAREAGDFKAVRKIERQLDKWAMEYGAYAPVKR